MYPRPADEAPFVFVAGLKQYEISNHLGNVLATVSDIKQAVDVTPPDGVVDYERAVVKTEQSYYPFGMLQPEMSYSFNSAKYRQGFNGMEKDNEIKGTGNSLDFGARIYDPRLGRWMSLDPYSYKYPYESNYVFVGNNPIKFIDPDGNFKLSADDKVTYKHLNNLLQKFDDKKVNESRLKVVFAKHSGLSSERTSEYLTYDEGPMLEVGQLSLASAAAETFFDDDQGRVRTVVQERHINKLERLGNKLEKLRNLENVSATKIERAEKRFNKIESKIEKYYTRVFIKETMKQMVVLLMTLSRRNK